VADESRGREELTSSGKPLQNVLFLLEAAHVVDDLLLSDF